MRQHVVHGVDALEIVGIEHVLPTGPGGRLFADIVLEQVQDRIEHIDHRYAQSLTGAVQIRPQRTIHKGFQHGAGLRLDAFQYAMELKARSDQTPAMIDDLHMLKLHSGGAGDRI